MNRSSTLSEQHPLFADLPPVDPSHVWDTLDDATRGQVVERIASLFVAHLKVDACRSVPPTDPSHGVNA